MGFLYARASFLIPLTCINQENVCKDRQSYSTTFVLYRDHKTTNYPHLNGPSLQSFAKYLADAMDKPYHVLRFTPQITSENSYPSNVFHTFFPVYIGIPRCSPALRFFDGLIFGYFYTFCSSQCCIQPFPAVQSFLFTVTFFAVPSTTPSSLRPLFYNPFLSFTFKGLGGGTKTFTPTITTTTTQKTTISVTTGTTTTERTAITLTPGVDLHIR